MKTYLLRLMVVALAAAAGCASVPQESIELSATLGRDLDAVHVANRHLATLSDGVADVLERARAVDADLGALPDEIKELTDRLP